MVTIQALTSAALKGTTITVAASPTPHAEILQEAKKILAKKGINLEIKEFTDYVQPNKVVDSGEIDANYFQHVPYLDDFNKKQGYKGSICSCNPSMSQWVYMLESQIL